MDGASQSPENDQAPVEPLSDEPVVAAEVADAPEGESVVDLLYRTSALADDNTRQCVYCGNRFDDAIFRQHLGFCPSRKESETLTQDAFDKIEVGPADLMPGTIYRVGDGPPQKKPYTKVWLEAQCDLTEAMSGEERLEARAKAALGEGVYFTWVDYRPPDGALDFKVTWNRIPYRLVPGQLNRVPNVVASVFENSYQATQKAFRPDGSSTDPSRVAAGQLYAGLGVGLIPDEEETPVAPVGG